MKCYICGNVANRRLSPDMDMQGIPLCQDADCRQILTLVMFTIDDPVKAEKKLNKIRKDKHLKNNNPWRP